MNPGDIFTRSIDFLLTCYSAGVLAGLVPAFLIAGGINVFIPKRIIFKYLGPDSNKFISYSIAILAGLVISVWSCTAIPLFSGIRKRGAGLGPSIAFLVSAPAADVVTNLLSFRLLGIDMGWANLVGDMVFAVIIGLVMNALFREKNRPASVSPLALPDDETNKKWWVNTVFFSLLIALMIFTTAQEWIISGILLLGVIVAFALFYSVEELKIWLEATFQFVRSLLPWFLAGSIGATLIAVFLPNWLVLQHAGINSLPSCLLSSVFGSIVYLCPPSEVLFTRAFMDLGMAKGPALCFLLTSPAVSLPSIMVLTKMIGLKKSVVYIGLFITLSTIVGYLFGLIIL